MTSGYTAYKHGRLDNEPSCETGYREKIEKLEQMVGRQAMEIEFLKKAIEYVHVSSKEKRAFIKEHGQFIDSTRRGCKLMKIAPSTYYYKPKRSPEARSI